MFKITIAFVNIYIVFANCVELFVFYFFNFRLRRLCERRLQEGVFTDIQRWTHFNRGGENREKQDHSCYSYFVATLSCERQFGCCELNSTSFCLIGTSSRNISHEKLKKHWSVSVGRGLQSFMNNHAPRQSCPQLKLGKRRIVFTWQRLHVWGFNSHSISSVTSCQSPSPLQQLSLVHVHVL